MTFGKDSHLHLIDGSAYIFRAYHALPPLSRKSDGAPVGAVAGFCNMLWRYVEGNSGPDAPTHAAVIFDKGSHTFRNDLYADYKGHRHLHLIDGSAFIFRAYHALPPADAQVRRAADRRGRGLLQHAATLCRGQQWQRRTRPMSR